jgi:hypothetical protein
MLTSIPASRLNQIGEGFGNHFRFNLMSSRSRKPQLVWDFLSQAVFNGTCRFLASVSFKR